MLNLGSRVKSPICVINLRSLYCVHLIFPNFLTAVYTFVKMPKCTIDDLAMIALILAEEEENFNQSNKLWIRKIFTKRKLVGKYYSLFKELEDDEISFFKYFTMFQDQFYMSFCLKLKTFFINHFHFC